jgi:hypothetical protein
MDGSQFDDFVRSWSDSRRSLLAGGFALAANWPGVPDVDAKKKRKKRKHKKRKPKKATPNEFGCFEVGDPCTSEADCCSSICDDGTCRAHDTGVCQQGEPGFCSATSTEEIAALACHGLFCFCFRTTAGSNVCSGGPGTGGENCADCKTDADCEALGFPAGSACAPVSGICGGCPSGTACLAPCAYE